MLAAPRAPSRLRPRRAGAPCPRRCVVVFDDEDFVTRDSSVVADTAYEALRTAFTAVGVARAADAARAAQGAARFALLPGEDLRGAPRQAREEVGEMTELIDDVLFLSELETGREVVALGETGRAGARDVVAALAERAVLADVTIVVRSRTRRYECRSAAHAPARRREPARELAAVRGRGRDLHDQPRARERRGRARCPDNGTGVPDEDVPRLFERFFRSDRARTTRGTGLGLAIVKHVVSPPGGNVEARGGRGRGLDVRCALPSLNWLWTRARVLSPPAGRRSGSARSSSFGPNA